MESKQVVIIGRSSRQFGFQQFDLQPLVGFWVFNCVQDSRRGGLKPGVGRAEEQGTQRLGGREMPCPAA